jgi:hypothetical protein
MLASLVDTKALLQSVVASAVAGIGITAAFSIMIFGIARSASLVRDERPLLASITGALAAIALLVCVGGIVLGIVAMTNK